MSQSSIIGRADEQEIRDGLTGGMSAAEVARLHGLNARAVSRFRARLRKEQAVAKRDAPVTREFLLEQAKILQGLIGGLVNQSAKQGNARNFVAASREMRGALELLGKIVGLLNESPQVNVNTTVNVDVAHLQAVVMDALRDLPDARQRVAQALLLDAEGAG